MGGRRRKKKKRYQRRVFKAKRKVSGGITW